MTYPVISARRIPYDIDGTMVGFRDAAGMGYTALFNNGIASWFSESSRSNLNKSDRSSTWTKIENYPCMGFWFFFPEIREIEFMGLLFPVEGPAGAFVMGVEGSADTTNGVDGTWETAVISVPSTNNRIDFWRQNIFSVSLSGPVKAIRVGMFGNDNTQYLRVSAIHLYGRKASGQTPDDIVFTDALGTEMTSLTDWGDRPEGTTVINPVFYLKNVSATKIANNVNIQLNHTDFAISLSADGPWASTLDISSINIGSLSSPIYVKNALSSPPLTLGPKAARAIITIGSWS